jgi:voltage-gated potassium channel
MREGGAELIAVVATLILILLVAVLIPVRFARAVRRSLKDPEFRSLFALVIALLGAGTLFYWYVEEWSVLDAFYFSAITLTTIGYGDLVPLTAAGKIFTVFYVFAGIGIIVAFGTAIAKASVEQREEMRERLRDRHRASASEQEDGDQ